jgi:hypothetical protein
LAIKQQNQVPEHDDPRQSVLTKIKTVCYAVRHI